MTAPTKQEMLDNLETAINAKLTGGAVQSYSIQGRSMQSFSLRELMDFREKLQKEIKSASGGMRTHASFDR